MPLVIPTLDDRSYEQILDEARQRIPSFTPEWTNFGVESDPGITIVELFAVLTESLLYRANRVPAQNRLKFLQLLGVPLQPAAAASGIVEIRHDRGPLAALTLDRGVVLSAGDVEFLTRDPMTVLPVAARVYVKRTVSENDPRFAEFEARYEAVRAAAQAAADAGSEAPPTVKLSFYEPEALPLPTPGVPNPAFDLANTIDGALWIALLAPPGLTPDEVRPVIANQTLSLGIVPALSGKVKPLLPRGSTEPGANTGTELVYEIADVSQGETARYARLQPATTPDVLNATGVVHLPLPGVSGLRRWDFTSPLQEGTGDFPPRLDDDEVSAALVTWLRVRLNVPGAGAAFPSARLDWAGVNATRVYQAVPIVNELAGTGTGEPDQEFTLANTPVLRDSIRVTVVDATNTGGLWRLVEDMRAVAPDEPVFELDPESGRLRFGVLPARRPPAGSRILASYEYGGGVQGNVGIGAINASQDPRLQGGYKIANPIPTAGGDLGETVEEAERDIPLVLRHRDRLVTETDFIDITRRTPGVDVGRVEVLPLFLPSNPRAVAPGVITLLVLPRFDPINRLWPTPDRLFLQLICDHLDERRLVTSEVYVRGPQYVPVYVTAGIQVRGGFFPDLVEAEARAALNRYLSSLPPGGPEGQGWPLNRRLIRKDLEAVITRVPGVEFVDAIEMGVRTPVDVAEHDLSGLELPILVGLALRAGPMEPLAAVFAPQPAADDGVQVIPVPVRRGPC